MKYEYLFESLEEDINKIRYKIAYFNWIKTECDILIPKNNSWSGIPKSISEIAKKIVDETSERIVNLSKETKIELFERGQSPTKALDLGFRSYGDEYEKKFSELKTWAINDIYENNLEGASMISTIQKILNDSAKDRGDISSSSEYELIMKEFADWEYTVWNNFKKRLEKKPDVEHPFK